MLQVIVDFGEVEVLGRTIGLRIYGYGLMLVVGFLAGIALARRRARRFGENPDAITTLGLLALVGGVVGARLAYVIERWDTQFAGGAGGLGEILNVTSGGLIYYGGVALAVAAVLAYLWAKRLPVRRYLDIIAPSLMLGLAFGRAGCLLNGCCYGAPCRDDCPFGMRFPYASLPLVTVGRSANLFGGASVSPVFAHQAATLDDQALRRVGVPEWLFREEPVGGEGSGGIDRLLKAPAELTDEQARAAAALRSLPVLPAQALAIVNALILTGTLLVFSRHRRREGQVFALMIILYPISRMVLEGLRGDNVHSLAALRLTHNQYTSLGMLAAGVVFWLALRRFPAGAGPTWGERLVRPGR